MDATILPPISGHALLILLLQMAGLLLLARTFAEIMRRLGQPAVIGELLAGIVLGPTVLGYFSPELFVLAFPQEVAQFHLLEVISWLGMVLLLLLTGLETDLRIVRTIGHFQIIGSPSKYICVISRCAKPWPKMEKWMCAGRQSFGPFGQG